MERQEYMNRNEPQVLIQAFPGSSQSDIVNITVFNTSTGLTEIDQDVMTACGNDSWKYAWTPTSAVTYLIKFFNSHTSVAEYLYADVQ